MAAEEQKSKKNKSRDLVFIALFAVLIAVCAWISIPTAVPFTMQTFGVFLALSFLGPGKGIVCVCVYLLLGLIGVPVYSNFTAGVGVLMGPNGGYMLGWILSGGIMWLMKGLLGKRRWAEGISMLVGLMACYALGTVWFAAVYARTSGPIGIWTALCWCVFPFVIPDLGKLGLALWFHGKLKGITQKL